MKLKTILIFFFLISVVSLPVLCYSPEITGRIETENKIYTDYIPDRGEETVDVFEKRMIWLRYRQQLAPGEYYFIRGQYAHSDYRERTYNSSKTFDLWSNYTFYVREDLRNRCRIDIRDKRYYRAEERSYYRLNLTYQLQYDHDDWQRYTLELQRRWNWHKNDNTRDNIRDVVSADWDYDINENLEITTGLRLVREIHDDYSASTNKYERRFSLNFKYRPD